MLLVAEEPEQLPYRVELDMAPDCCGQCASTHVMSFMGWRMGARKVPASTMVCARCGNVLVCWPQDLR